MNLRNAPGVFILLLALCARLEATPANYAGQDLSNKDFHDGSFNGANFEGADLRSANLTNATCRNANFRHADLTGANLSRAVMDGADFTGAKIARATLHDARFHDVKLSGAEIHLAGASVIDTSLVLEYTDAVTIKQFEERVSGSLSFERADLRHARVLGNAEGVDFRSADLRGADLSKAVNLDKARLKGAKYDAETRWNIDPAAMGAELTAAE